MRGGLKGSKSGSLVVAMNGVAGALVGWRGLFYSGSE